MGAGDERAASALRVGYLFTRFPVPTETFLQREVEALRQLGEAPAVFALWTGGRPAIDSPLRPTHQFRPWHLFSLFAWIPYWLWRRPRAMGRLATALQQARVSSLENGLEILLGLGYAIARARALKGTCDHFHAVWASAPATAAWALHELLGVPFSMAGHAYDLYEHGGDGLLPVKIPPAVLIRTSTEVGRRRWEQLGADPRRLVVIRRGLASLPPRPGPRAPHPPYRILAVGRLVEKMGYPFFLEVLWHLQARGVPFQATVVGAGPLMKSLQARARRLALTAALRFLGGLPYAEVEPLYRAADLFLFTGEVAATGDRAGFPNALGEAMAWGVPVCARPVGAVLEGVQDNRTGLVIRHPREAAERIEALFANPTAYAGLRQAGRLWVEQAFNAQANMRQWVESLATAHRQNLPGGPES